MVYSCIPLFLCSLVTALRIALHVLHHTRRFILFCFVRKRAMILNSTAAFSFRFPKGTIPPSPYFSGRSFPHFFFGIASFSSQRGLCQ
jgi:hypothetical protein